MLFYNFFAIAAFFATACLAHDQSTKDGKDAHKNEKTDVEAGLTDKAANDSKVTEFISTDCSKLDATQLNALTNLNLCTLMTATCVDQFDVTKVNHECLAKISMDSWKEFTTKTVNEIVNAPHENLSLSAEHFKLIYSKINFAGKLDGIAGYVVRTPSLLEVVFETHDAGVIAAFINASSMPAMPLSSFTRFSKDFVAILNADAFSNIQPVQLALIPSHAFSGLTPAQVAKINPAALINITHNQASELQTECWNAMTLDQIKNFGASVVKFNAMGLKNNVLDRRQFKTLHPCNALEEKKGTLSKEQQTAFEERCKEITSFRINNGASITTMAATGALFFAAAIPALF